MSSGPDSDSWWVRHRPFLRFLATLTVVYGVWYGLYDLWLLPDGRLDRWVSLSVVQATETLLTVVGFEAGAEARLILLSGTPGLKIVDGCNGLASMGLFVGFVVAYPGRAWRRALFLPLGLLAVYLSNVGRLTGMLLLRKYWPAGSEVVHNIGAPLFFYTVVFGLWVLWVHYGGADEMSSPDADEQPQRTFA